MARPRRETLTAAAAALLAIPLLVKGIRLALGALPGDLANYWLAGRLALDGAFTAAVAYDFYAFNQALAARVPGELGAWLPNPPPAFVLTLPLAALPIEAARLIFLGVNFALIGLVAWALSKGTGLRRWESLGLLLLSGRALYSQLAQGQLYLVLLASIALAVFFVGRGKDALGGLALGLLIPVKLVTAPIAAAQLLRGRWAFTAGAALGAALPTAVALALVGPGPFEAWLLDALPRHLAGQIQDPFTAIFQAADPMLRRLFVADVALNPSPVKDDPALARALGAAFHRGVWLVALAALAGRWARLRAARAEGGGAQPRGDAAFPAELAGLTSVLLTAGVVGAPATASYHMLLLAPAVALHLAPRSPLRPAPWVGPALVTLYAAACFLPTARLLALDGRGLLTVFAHLRLWVGLAFFGALVAEDLRAAARALPGGWARLGAAVAAAGLMAIPPKAAQPGPGDGARWVRVPGLILAAPTFDGETLAWHEAAESGFTGRQAAWERVDPFKAHGGGEGDGSPGLAAAPGATGEPPPPRRTSLTGRYQLRAVGEPLPGRIEVVDTTTGAARLLTEASTVAWDPVFCPDDSCIVFLSDRGRGVRCGALYALPFDGVGEGP